jgi:hypothetical protein
MVEARIAMRNDEIIEFVTSRIEPIPPAAPYGERYRLSATLTDGTYLPCIVVESASKTVELAIRRFRESENVSRSSMGYDAVVNSFVTRGNTVNYYDIKELSISPFAIPLARVCEIRGETSMSWTEFYATMSDGMEFCFGTVFLREFFDMPRGYTAIDIQKIVPAVRGEKRRCEPVYREKPFFTCYVDGI